MAARSGSNKQWTFPSALMMIRQPEDEGLDEQVAFDHQPGPGSGFHQRDVAVRVCQLKMAFPVSAAAATFSGTQHDAVAFAHVVSSSSSTRGHNGEGPDEKRWAAASALPKTPAGDEGWLRSGMGCRPDLLGP